MWCFRGSLHYARAYNVVCDVLQEVSVFDFSSGLFYMLLHTRSPRILASSWVWHLAWYLIMLRLPCHVHSPGPLSARVPEYLLSLFRPCQLFLTIAFERCRIPSVDRTVVCYGFSLSRLPWEFCIAVVSLASMIMALTRASTSTGTGASASGNTTVVLLLVLLVLLVLLIQTS